MASGAQAIPRLDLKPYPKAASDERRWVIQAKTTGTATLTLKLWREWEGDPSVIERYQVTLAITP